MENGMEQERTCPVKLRARFEFDSPAPEEITMKPTLFYGEVSFHPLREETVPSGLCRDEAGEFQISRLITRYFSYWEQETKNLIIRADEDAMYRLLREGIDSFRALGEVRLSERFCALRVLPFPKVSAVVSVESGGLKLKLDAGGLDRTGLVRFLSDEKQRQKGYVRLESGAFLELSEEKALALVHLAEDLGIQAGAVLQPVLRLPAYRACSLDASLRGTEAFSFAGDRAFSDLVRDLREIGICKAKLPQSFSVVLREYQKKGFFWLHTLDRYGFGGILADDMGLGKTIQVFALFSSLYGAEASSDPMQPPQKRSLMPSLVLCPASLIYHWGQEWKRFAPFLRVLLVTGSKKERERKLAAAEEYDVLITSYELLRRDLSSYEGMSFRFLVLDEAQQIKNAATKLSRSVKTIQAQTRFALTGTPVENRLGELWNLFDFLMPDFLFSYRKFKSEFELPIGKEGDEMAAARLRNLIRPFVLRRLKREVLRELPQKLEQVYYSVAEGKQLQLYQNAAKKLRQDLAGCGETGWKNEAAVKQTGNGKIEILAGLTRLRQLCCDPALCIEGYDGGSAKLETCLSLLTSAVEAGHGILVFSQFASMLERIAGRLKQEGISYFLLTGAAKKEERSRMVREFQSHAVPVFLISLKAGGTGLNLTAADMVIHYDPWWNLAAQNQASDRAYRIGQNRQVMVCQLILKDTIEEAILRLQQKKQKLADQIVQEGMVSLGELKREELWELLGGANESNP